MVYTGQITGMRVPIVPDKEDKDDEERAKAIHRFSSLAHIQVHECPYQAEHYGLCQLVFLLRP